MQCWTAFDFLLHQSVSTCIYSMYLNTPKETNEEIKSKKKTFSFLDVDFEEFMFFNVKLKFLFQLISFWLPSVSFWLKVKLSNSTHLIFFLTSFHHKNIQSLEMFQIKHGQSPEIVSDIFTQTTQNYNLRQNEILGYVLWNQFITVLKVSPT